MHSSRRDRGPLSSAWRRPRPDFVFFGRNEPTLHHYHNTYRARLGTEPLALLADENAANH